ncbi:MAG: hypothetical protein HRU03_08270, partial [Nanoarchaeales archaeon]|nr:hypothetical protein [Nanoarchaeales archaeon]
MDKNKCDIIFENGLENNFPLLQLIENNKKNGKFTGKNSSSKINKQRTFSREIDLKNGMKNLFNSIKNRD